MMGVPPTVDGGVQCRLTAFCPGSARNDPGAPGTAPRAAVGVAAGEGRDAGPAPWALAAWTVNVYAVPLVRPVTTAYPRRWKSRALTVAVRPPGDAVTV